MTTDAVTGVLGIVTSVASSVMEIGPIEKFVTLGLIGAAASLVFTLIRKGRKTAH